MRRYKVDITTDAGGAATVYGPRVVGRIHSVHYVKDATVAFANGVDFALSAEATGENIWTEADVNASAVRYPRAATHTQAGAASLYAAGGTPVQDKIGLASDRVKIVIAQGGNAKKGAVIILID